MFKGTYQQTKELAIAAWHVNEPMFLLGQPGIGKTALPHDVVDYINTIEGHNRNKVYEFSLGTLAVEDMRGVPVPDLENMVLHWLVDQGLPKDPDACGYVFFDEYLHATPALQAPTGRIILERIYPDGTPVPKGIRFIAASNRQKDKAATHKMPGHLKANRFWMVEMDADLEEWLEWGREITDGRRNIHPTVSMFMNYQKKVGKGEESFCPEFDPDAQEIITPRGIHKFSNALWLYENDHKMIKNIAVSLLGNAWAETFDGWWETYADIPRLDDIVNNPDTAPLPTKAEGATTSMLAHALTKNNAVAICTYLRRFKARDSVSFTLNSAIARDPSLKNVPVIVEAMKEYSPNTL